MAELNKEDLVFQRGEDGNLIPQDVILESIESKPTIKVVPLTRGKLQEIYQKATSDSIQEKLEADADIIECGLVNPKLTKEEIKDIKPQMALAINQAILSISLGISQDEVGKKTEEMIATQEYLLKKK